MELCLLKIGDPSDLVVQSCLGTANDGVFSVLDTSIAWRTYPFLYCMDPVNSNLNIIRTNFDGYDCTSRLGDRNP